MRAVTISSARVAATIPERGRRDDFLNVEHAAQDAHASGVTERTTPLLEDDTLQPPPGRRSVKT